MFDRVLGAIFDFTRDIICHKVVSVRTQTIGFPRSQVKFLQKLISKRRGFSCRGYSCVVRGVSLNNLPFSIQHLKGCRRFDAARVFGPA